MTHRPARCAEYAGCCLLAGLTITLLVDHQAQQEIDHVYPAENPLWRMPIRRACCQLEADLACGVAGNSVVLAIGPGLPVFRDVRT
jgi:hypothetical protein